MFERIDYLWRLCATAFSFFVFGLAGIIWVFLFPVVEIFLGTGPDKKRKARNVMHWVFRCYIALLRGLGLLSYEVHGRERLNQPGSLVIANHPSLIDVVFLISLIRNASCIVKPALVHNPFMRAPIRTMSYLFAEDPEMLLTRCAEDLGEGSSLIVFPEGTRTTLGKPLRFQRGAANIALKSGANIVPVYIDCKPTTLTKQEKWYQIPPKKVHFRLMIGKDIDPAQMAGNHPRSIASRKLTRYLEQYFCEQERAHGKS
ncbi:MAG: 1-acyl-sn-glycerol-3-phosphate acyltransferase [Methylococcaceae bacterium]|nr:1-acyl-sn-glycerol-3-phosphate acyltransferase [Methylococcaceae bacterium]